jgi:chromosome segregation ATPase
MRLSLLLPWLCVLGLLVGLAALYSTNQKKEAELAGLRQDSLDLQALRAEVETNKSQTQGAADELARLRKDNEELLRLRNEVRQLRADKLQLDKQVKDSQAQVQQAQAQAQGAQAQAEALRQGAVQAAQSAQQQAQQQAQVNACLNNLRQIDAAKQQWALANRRPPTAVPVLAELAPYMKSVAAPTCPAGGAYSINAVGTPATCSIPGHVLPK